jgi:hypothetical protein
MMYLVLVGIEGVTLFEGCGGGEWIPIAQNNYYRYRSCNENVGCLYLLFLFVFHHGKGTAIPPPWGMGLTKRGKKRKKRE